MKVQLMIDNIPVEAEAGTSILNAALQAGIYIPHLCGHPSLKPAGECKLCVVHLDGSAEVVTACETPVKEGMRVDTQAADLKEIRCLSVELMLTNHPTDCTTCTKYGKCELQSIKQYLGVSDERLHKGTISQYRSEENPLINRELARCILCGRCVRACGELRGVKAIDFVTVDGVTSVMPVSGNGSLADSGCRFCGACVEVCPTGALLDKPGFQKHFLSREEALVPCRSECPIQTDVPRYLAFMRQNRPDQALAVIREKATFPLSLGYICMRFCEKMCRRGDVNEAINIRGVKKQAALLGGDSWKRRTKNAPATGKRVAVIGAGPAGLTSAYYLQRKGHEVTVFEKLPEPGGMLTVGIPKDRLPAWVVKKEIAEILETGVRLECNRSVTPKPLLDEGYDAVVVAVGTHRGTRLSIPGSDLPDVHTGVEFLKKFAMGAPERIGKKVLVLGGGNVAFDVANTARQQGAEKITMACLEARETMTASEEEVLEALDWGLELLNGKTFHRIEKTAEGLAVNCSNVAEMGTDENGAFRIVEEPNSERTILADTVIFATGQIPDLDASFGLSLGRGNRIQSKESMTSLPGVFAAGDAVTGTASVVGAIRSGREAASHADLYLGGNGDISEQLADHQPDEPYIGRKEGFAEMKRYDGACDQESERCLQCHLRLGIQHVSFWNEYRGGQQHEM